MQSLFAQLSGFLPHGVCFSWNPALVWLHATADGLIALAYFSIPFALWVFVRHRIDLRFLHRGDEYAGEGVGLAMASASSSATAAA